MKNDFNSKMVYFRCCSCRKLTSNEEKKIISYTLIVFLLAQSLFIFVICYEGIINLLRANLSLFLPIDLVTILISVAILGLLILVIGISSTKTNIFFIWILFHIFLFLMLMIELFTTWVTSDINGIMNIAKKSWGKMLLDDIAELQFELNCCGFENMINASQCPVNADVPCKIKLNDLLSNIRNYVSILLFIDFIFAMFIDFMGCAICFHPEISTPGDKILDETPIDLTFGREFETTNSPFVVIQKKKN